MLEYEGSFLACILVDPSIVFKTSLDETHFDDPQCRQLYRAMRACADRRVKIDYISVRDIDQTLDPTYAPRLHDAIPSAANWKFYEGKIVEGYQRRKLADLGRLLAAIESQSDPVEYIERAEKDLLELSTCSATNQIVSLDSLILPALHLFEERFKNKGKLPGLSSGLDGLDGMTNGFQPSRYYVIGARPSDGKSALALNIVCHLGIHERVPVGIISAESSNDEIIARMFAAEGRVNGQHITTGLLTNADFSAFMTAGEGMRGAPVYLYDTPNVRFTELKSIARQMVALHKVRAIFVDYLQIIQWQDRNLAKHEQVASVSLGLKELARELRVPVIALAQLRRDSEGREPEMADLADSSQVEKDADAIVFIHHPKPKKDEEVGCSFLLVKKNRDGPKGAVAVNFQREYVRFYSAQYEGRAS